MHSEVKACIYLLNGIYVGFQVTQSAMDQFNAGQNWDVVPNPGAILGGHCVYGMVYQKIFGYTEDGPLCITWGKRQQMTWAFWDKYVDEAYGIVDNKDDWTDPDHNNIDVVALEKILEEITGQPMPPPVPEPPPPEPVPPKPPGCLPFSRLFRIKR